MICGGLRINAHPDLEMCVVNTGDQNKKAILIGFALDPSRPEASSVEVLSRLVNAVTSKNELIKWVRNLSGRFVLIFMDGNDLYLFHDPLGLRSVYYTWFDNQFFCGSQPYILQQVLPITVADDFTDYLKSSYVKGTKEHWIPSGANLFNRVEHLVPNHYLALSSRKQLRFWPDRELTPLSLKSGAELASKLLSQLITAAHFRFKLALPLTAGWDSRLTLCGAKDWAAELYFYTLQYRDLKTDSADIAIARTMLSSFGLQHHLVDCRRSLDHEFGRVYCENSPMAHLDDWGHIAFGMLQGYPSDCVCLKSNGAEICRCFFYHSGKHKAIGSVEQIISLEPGWAGLALISNALNSWFPDARRVAEQAGIDLLDLFYWEHRIGGWQAQSQLEWDIVQEVFTPFNDRSLLETMLSVPAQYRSGADFPLFKEMYRLLWPEVLNYPINPPEGLVGHLKEQLHHLGLAELAKEVRKRWLALRFRMTKTHFSKK